MRRHLMFTAPLLAVLAACGTRPPAAPPPSPPPPAGGPPPRATLAAEAARLAEFFRGTPVVFAMSADGVLRVSVPRGNSFEPGSFRVKPALGAVLERLARSQAASGSRFKVAAPADVAGRGGSLPGERALSVRDYLVGHGLGVARVQAAGTAATDAVEITVTEVPGR